MDVDLFKQRFLPFHPKLYRVAYALTGNQQDAEDILQEAYCKLWKKRDELDGIDNPEAFCVTMVKNLALDLLRSPRANSSSFEDPLNNISLDSGSTPESELEDREAIRGVKLLINRLPERQREVIRLRSIENLSYEDIENITGLSSSNIRTLLSRARKSIKESFLKLNGYG